MSANSEMERFTMPETPPEQPAPQAPAATPAAPAATPETGKQPPWGTRPENFDPDKAWDLIQGLRSEKSTHIQLQQEFDDYKQQQAKQQQAIASMFGVKPDETSDTEKLSAQFNTLQQQIVASERRALAAEHKVPEALLTGGDAEAMRAQAIALVEFAQGAHAAASTASTEPASPAFHPIPGQGQTGQPQAPGYEQFYDPATGRPRF